MALRPPFRYDRDAKTCGRLRPIAAGVWWGLQMRRRGSWVPEADGEETLVTLSRNGR